jgi:hypothetical protein
MATQTPITPEPVDLRPGIPTPEDLVRPYLREFRAAARRMVDAVVYAVPPRDRSRVFDACLRLVLDQAWRAFLRVLTRHVNLDRGQPVPPDPDTDCTRHEPPF